MSESLPKTGAPFPLDWSVVLLGELEAGGLLLFKNGFSCGDHEIGGTGIPHLRPFNVTEDGRVSLHEVKTIPHRPGIEEYALRPADILYNNTNSEELVGKCAYWSRQDGPFVLSNHMTIMRVLDPDKIDPHFLALHLYWLWLTGSARMMCRRHVNQASISLERMRQLVVHCPPRVEQRAIAMVLGKLQAAVEVQEKIVATLRELKAATMAKLFREGLVRGFMFDTHIFDKILDGQIDPSQFRPGIRLFGTHVQRDEIERCRDASRRQGLLEVFDLVDQEVVPTESAVWDVSRWGGAKWGGSGTLEQLRMGNPKHTEDALIGETCIRQNLVLVTEENSLRKRVHRAGGEAISFEDFLTGRWRRLKQTEIGEIPESWDVSELGRVARIERGKFAHRPRNDPRFYGGNVPFIQTGDVAKSNGRIRTYSQTLNKEGLAISRVFPKGTIVLTIAANIADTGILEFDSAFPDSLVGVTPDETMDPVFLEYYLRTQKSEMNRLAPKGTQKNINIQFLKPWPVPRPSSDEQREVAHGLRCIDDRLDGASAGLDTLRGLFFSMLHLLMAGKVRLPGFRQTPNLDSPWFKPEDVSDFVGRLVRKFDPEKVILFGSRAWGTPTRDSDVDLLVVMEFEGRPVDMAVRIGAECDDRFPVDLIVRRPVEVERRIAMSDPFFKQILRDGLVLHERAT